MTLKHFREETETALPFKVAGKGAWISWAVIGSGIAVSFGAGAWASNMRNEMTEIHREIYDIHESQKSMKEDISWLVHHELVGPNKEVVVAEAAK